jgi:hypothetical protein
MASALERIKTLFMVDPHPVINLVDYWLSIKRPLIYLIFTPVVKPVPIPEIRDLKYPTFALKPSGSRFFLTLWAMILMPSE